MGAGEKAVVGRGLGGFDGLGFDHQLADAEVFVEVRVDPAVVADVGLLEDDRAAGVDVDEHAEAEVDGLDDVAFDAGEAFGLGVDPHAAFEAGEELGDGGGWLPVRVGVEV